MLRIMRQSSLVFNLKGFYTVEFGSLKLLVVATNAQAKLPAWAVAILGEVDKQHLGYYADVDPNRGFAVYPESKTLYYMKDH